MDKCCLTIDICWFLFFTDSFLSIFYGGIMQDYIFSNDFSRNLDAMIYTCGYETCEPGHSYGPVVRSGYLIHYILKGKGIYKTDGHIYQLSEGDAFLIRPDTLIYYEADKFTPWTYTWIGFQGIKMHQYFSRTSLLERPCFHYEKDDRVRLCHEKMYEAFHLTENRDLMMNSILYEYLYLLTSKFPQKNILLEEKQQSYVEETLKYIENNYYHTCNIQDIADTLNLERTYLYRLFKNKTGFSMQEYLIDYRIRKACDLLRKTTLLISDIARSVGYEDSLYFSKLFKAKKGTTPSFYRKQLSL